MSRVAESRQAAASLGSDVNPRLMMLVSDRVDDHLRAAVSAGERPCPEFLRLESDNGIRLLDWSQVGHDVRHRSPASMIRHVVAALGALDGVHAVFSDGEHVGIPLGLALSAGQMRPGHLVLAHHLTTPRKRLFIPLLKSDRVATRVLVHSQRQYELLAHILPERKVALVPYGIDEKFWQPIDATCTVDDELVLAVGQEHRDYETLSVAAGELGIRLRIAAGSSFSPGARHRDAARLPPRTEVGFADHAELRRLYARAAVVVVPLVENDFQAGITSILEAMAMAKPVIVTRTRGQRDVVIDDVDGVLVPPADPTALKEALVKLLGDPARRNRLGRAARATVERRFGSHLYSTALAGHLAEVGAA